MASCYILLLPALPCHTKTDIQQARQTAITASTLNDIAKNILPAELNVQICDKWAADWAGEPAIHLLERMLAFDPDRRIGAEEALTHEYFTSLETADLDDLGAALEPLPPASGCNAASGGAE